MYIWYFNNSIIFVYRIAKTKLLRKVIPKNGRSKFKSKPHPLNDLTLSSNRFPEFSSIRQVQLISDNLPSVIIYVQSIFFTQ